MRPLALICDAAGAIKNGYIASFGIPEKIIMCFAHVMMNVQKLKFNNQDNKELMKQDIRELQFLCSEQFFDIGSRLFVQKWKAKEQQAVEQFQKSFIDHNKYWFEGSLWTVPKTNNALESFNGSLKVHQTFWQKKSLAHFKTRLLEIVEQRSKEYREGTKMFQDTVELEETDKRNGLAYANSEKQFNISKITQNDQIIGILHVFTGDNSRFEITKDEVHAYVTQDWNKYKKFEDFIAAVNDMHAIMVPEQKNDWLESKCTCKRYAKAFMCKHIVAYAIREKILIDESSLATFIEPNRKRGRVKKATRALHKD